jgi:plastocyanin domain-containing protein
MPFSTNKAIIGSLVVTVLALGGIVALSRSGGPNSVPSSEESPNVYMEDGKQIINITAKGGYSPRNVMAKANVPTVIRMITNGTFDCSSALNVSAVGFRGNLPPSGTTPIEVPPQKSGATIDGVCAMGMYSFAVNFN